MIILPVYYRLYCAEPVNHTDDHCYFYEKGKRRWLRQEPTDNGGWQDTHVYDWDIDINGTVLETFKKIQDTDKKGSLLSNGYVASVHGYVIDKFRVAGFVRRIYFARAKWDTGNARIPLADKECSPPIYHLLPASNKIVNIRFPEILLEENRVVRDYCQDDTEPVLINCKSRNRGLISDYNVTLQGNTMRVVCSFIDEENSYPLERECYHQLYEAPPSWRDWTFGQLAREVVERIN